VAYTVQGEPLTKSMYIQKIKEATASVKAGNHTTVEDLEKEAETGKCQKERLRLFGQTKPKQI